MTKDELRNRALPFKCEILDTVPQVVKNPYNGDECLLQPDALAVYDTIKGCEMYGMWDDVRRGLDWFRENEPKAYMILLD